MAQFSAATVEKLSWMLVYAGLLAMIIGLFARREGAVLGWLLIGAGAVATTAGALLVYVRSRMTDDAGPPHP